MNEGVSDYAQTITGYVDPSIPITQIGFDSHIQCFLGLLNDASRPRTRSRDRAARRTR